MVKIQDKIVYQGEAGANSHLACIEAYPQMEPISCKTFDDVFEAVARGDAELGMIPIENNLAGRVADIHLLMPETGLSIVGEHFHSVHHDLLAVADAEISDIEEVHSHVMALDQCRKIIKEFKLHRVNAVDTAGAAKDLAETDNKHSAAIATSLAAKIYGLKVLKSNIEDEEYNITRFIILRKEPLSIKNHTGLVITSFIFNVRNVPASLYKALGGFATNGVNMTKLESYQVGGSLFSTMFYADIEGHPDDVSVQFAMEELGFFTSEIKIFGTYPASPMREEMKQIQAQ